MDVSLFSPLNDKTFYIAIKRKLYIKQYVLRRLSDKYNWTNVN